MRRRGSAEERNAPPIVRRPVRRTRRVSMRWHIAVAALALLGLTATGPNAVAQSSGSAAGPQDRTLDLAQAGRFGRPDMDDDEEPDEWRRPAYRDRDGGRYDRGPAIMERRRQGPADDWHRDRRRFSSGGMLAGPMGRPGMLAMMMILMDTDGDGAVSLQEFQAGLERIFKAMDADKDGKL